METILSDPGYLKEDIAYSLKTLIQKRAFSSTLFGSGSPGWETLM